MRLILSDITATLIYLVSLIFLIREFQMTPEKNRWELQTGPLLLASTFFYFAFMAKTHQFAAFFFPV